MASKKVPVLEELSLILEVISWIFPTTPFYRQIRVFSSPSSEVFMRRKGSFPRILFDMNLCSSDMINEVGVVPSLRGLLLLGGW